MSRTQEKSTVHESRQSASNALLGRLRGIVAPPNAYGFRIARIKGDELIYYEPITFKNPFDGCKLYLHRWSMIGYIVDNVHETDFLLDVLDKEQDIIDTFGLTKHGFDKIKYQLRPKRERYA